MTADVERFNALAECPPDWPPEWYYDYATRVLGLVPSQEPGSWSLRCRRCETIQTGLDFFEAFALEGLGRGHSLVPCCIDPNRIAEATVYVRSPDPCRLCGHPDRSSHACQIVIEAPPYRDDADTEYRR